MVECYFSLAGTLQKNLCPTNRKVLLKDDGAIETQVHSTVFFGVIASFVVIERLFLYFFDD